MDLRSDSIDPLSAFAEEKVELLRISSGLAFDVEL